MFTYFDDYKHSAIHVDANNISVGAALIQDHKVVEYHGRALAVTQQWYTNIGREAYAFLNGVKHFNHYVFSKPFDIHTDHQLLV